MKTIGITGGTGLIGKHLSSLLVNHGYKVIIFTRSPSKYTSKQPVTYARWDQSSNACDIAAIKSLSAMVHLAGAGVADKRWTKKRKDEIRHSRVNGTRFIISILKEHGNHCKTFVTASATGYYGPDHSPVVPFTETAQAHEDFLGTTCMQWENESHKAEAFARTVVLRFGIALAKESGAFPEFAKPLSLGVMPILGGGKQVISWIEADDLARMILFAIEHENVSGTYNAVAPKPVTQKDLMKTIAATKGGLAIPVPAPAFLLRAILGEMSTEVLKSCTVTSQKVIEAGFKFNHTEIGSAVKAILSN